MNALLLVIIAHGCADFIFQSDRVVLAKKEFKLSGYLIHALTVFFSIVVFLHGYQWQSVLLFGLIVTGTHIGFDWIKSWLPGTNPVINLIGFGIDQVVHLLAILLIWQASNLQPDPAVNAFYRSLVQPKTIAVFQQTLPQLGIDLTRILMVVVIYLYVCWVGGIVVRKFLDWVVSGGDTGPANQLHFQKNGFFIGVLERFLIVTLVINNAVSAVAFVFAAKSVARFGELNDKKFAEYYLTGTLTSTALAVLGGFLLKAVLGFSNT